MFSMSSHVSLTVHGESRWLVWRIWLPLFKIYIYINLHFNIPQLGPFSYFYMGLSKKIKVVIVINRLTFSEIQRRYPIKWILKVISVYEMENLPGRTLSWMLSQPTWKRLNYSKTDKNGLIYMLLLRNNEFQFWILQN